MTRVYLSGAMSGKDDLNFPLFNREATRLRSMGYRVVNPAELNPDPRTPWHECMKNDLKALLDCESIVMLEGWEDSQGAHLELHIAHRVGIKVRMARDIP